MKWIACTTFLLLTATAEAKTTSALPKVREWRFETASGPVRAWLPPDYRADRAGIVVYAHGYWTQVDEAWQKQSLVEQFRKSGLDALFIAPAAPRENGDDVKFPRLADLLRETAKRTQMALPKGPITIVGHSGGFRTLLPWLSHPGVRHVVLLDGLYAGEEKFLGWAKDGPHMLTIVGQDTAARIEPILRAEKGIAWLGNIPAAFSPRERGARVLYMHSQYNHGEMVTNGKVIPLVLRRAPGAAVPGIRGSARRG
jgi:hypothetical protein